MQLIYSCYYIGAEGLLNKYKYMIYQANELNLKLNNLTLVGQEDGELQFIGTDKDWDSAVSQMRLEQADSFLSDDYNPADKYEN
jgi:hypothetical protein